MYSITFQGILICLNGTCILLQKNGHSYIAAEDPDVICLQETKCDEDSLPAELMLTDYHRYWYSAEKAGYAGTGLLSKVKPIDVTYGIGKP